MDAPELCEELGRVVFGEEQVVDGGGDFDPQPLGELAVLNAEFGYRLLEPDFFKELREAVALDNVLAEPRSKGQHLVSR